jgi:hypothetical protein
MGLGLTRDQYYNLLRNSSLRKSDDSFKGLMAALDEAGFVFRTKLMPQQIVDGVRQPAMMEQIVFFHLIMRYLAQRFCSEFAFIIDGTFNTNRLRMPFIQAVGITNTGTSFPVVFSFAMSESKLAFDFIFETINSMIFTGQGVEEPGVIIADQAAGLVVSMPTSMPDTPLQFCDWHCAENIRKRLAKNGYTKDERDKIMDTVWQYIKTDEEYLLDVQRAALCQHLKKDEVSYIDTYWRPKEPQVIRCHTRHLLNLGCNSSQRVESFHPIFKQVLHGQLTLEQAARRTGEQVQRLLRDLSIDEDRSRIQRPNIVDEVAFRLVIGRAIHKAILLVAHDWEGLKQAFNANRRICQPSEECDCELPLRYGLPCAYRLSVYMTTGTPIPLALFHPRWFLGGRPLVNSAPSNPQPAAPVPRDYLESTKTTTTMHEMLQLRDGLNSEHKLRLDSMLIKQAELAKSTATSLTLQSNAPVALPAPIPKAKWVQYRKQHDKTGTRGMTGAEIAVRAANTVEKAAKKVDNEVARESRRQAESQGGTTITVGTKASTSDLVSPDSPSAVLGSSDSLPPSLEVMLGLPEREDTPPEEDLGLEALFWLPPDPEDQSHAVPPSVSAPEPRRSKRVLSVAGYYAALAGKSSRKARK